MPIFVLLGLGGFVALVFTALVGDNVNQREQRENDLRKYRSDLADKEARIATLESKYRVAMAEVGSQSEMTRRLVEELVKLRAEVVAMKRESA